MTFHGLKLYLISDGKMTEHRIGMEKNETHSYANVCNLVRGPL